MVWVKSNYCHWKKKLGFFCGCQNTIEWSVLLSAEFWNCVNKWLFQVFCQICLFSILCKSSLLKNNGNWFKCEQNIFCSYACGIYIYFLFCPFALIWPSRLTECWKVIIYLSICPNQYTCLVFCSPIFILY